MEQKIGMILKHYTGYDIWDNQWRGADMAVGWTPYLASVLATYGIPKLVSIIRRL